MALRKLPVYLVAQFTGSVLAGLALYVLLAPLTQAGLNLARNLGARLVAWLPAGGELPFLTGAARWRHDSSYAFSSLRRTARVTYATAGAL